MALIITHILALTPIWFEKTATMVASRNSGRSSRPAAAKAAKAPPQERIGTRNGRGARRQREAPRVAAASKKQKRIAEGESEPEEHGHAEVDAGEAIAQERVVAVEIVRPSAFGAAATAAPAPEPPLSAAPAGAAELPADAATQEQLGAQERRGAQEQQGDAEDLPPAARPRRPRGLPAGLGPTAKAKDEAEGLPEAVPLLRPVSCPPGQGQKVAAPEGEELQTEGLDHYQKALQTKREDLRPPPGEDDPYFVWKPSRIGADAAPAGPNGIISACDLKAGEYKVGMCVVHIERNIVQQKHSLFTKFNDEGKLKYPEVFFYIASCN